MINSFDFSKAFLNASSSAVCLQEQKIKEFNIKKNSLDLIEAGGSLLNEIYPFYIIKIKTYLHTGK